MKHKVLKCTSLPILNVGCRLIISGVSQVTSAGRNSYLFCRRNPSTSSTQIYMLQTIKSFSKIKPAGNFHLTPGIFCKNLSFVFLKAMKVSASPE